MILSFRFVFSLMVSRHCDKCNDDAGTMMQKFLKSHRQFFVFTLNWLLHCDRWMVVVNICVSAEC
jgi:hypothetical protein